MALFFKKGVSLAGARPEIIPAIYVANEVFFELGKNCTVTSVTDSKHGYGSLHYVGLAFDLRTKHISKGEVVKVARELKRRLTKEYDVVVEETHIHVEYQPK